MSGHHFNATVVGAYCRFTGSLDGWGYWHTHGMGEPCPLNFGRPWGVSWRAADHTERNGRDS
jgi:hypothetical protein